MRVRVYIYMCVCMSVCACVCVCVCVRARACVGVCVDAAQHLRPHTPPRRPPLLPRVHLHRRPPLLRRSASLARACPATWPLARSHPRLSTLCPVKTEEGCKVRSPAPGMSYARRSWRAGQARPRPVLTIPVHVHVYHHVHAHPSSSVLGTTPFLIHRRQYTGLCGTRPQPFARQRHLCYHTGTCVTTQTPPSQYEAPSALAPRGRRGGAPLLLYYTGLLLYYTGLQLRPGTGSNTDTSYTSVTVRGPVSVAPRGRRPRCPSRRPRASEQHAAF